MSVSPIKSFADLDSADIFALPVHPAAEVFPMLPEDELEELAESIKANGLFHALVVDKGDSGYVLIDGRNRREACRRAGVSPRVKPMEEGWDPATYVVSANIKRRHLTKGQRAMAVAMIYPEAKRGMHSELKNSTGEFDKALVSHARSVLRHTPDAAALVLTGAMSLDAAYKHAHDIKLGAEGEEGVMRTLRTEAPDLADQVVEGTLTLAEASAALRVRQEAEANSRLGAFLILNHASTLATTYGEYSKGFKHLSGHWHEFQTHTQYTRADLIGQLKTLQSNLPNIIKQIQESED